MENAGSDKEEVIVPRMGVLLQGMIENAPCQLVLLYAKGVWLYQAGFHMTACKQSY